MISAYLKSLIFFGSDLLNFLDLQSTPQICNFAIQSTIKMVRNLFFE